MMYFAALAIYVNYAKINNSMLRMRGQRFRRCFSLWRILARPLQQRP